MKIIPGFKINLARSNLSYTFGAKPLLGLGDSIHFSGQFLGAGEVLYGLLVHLQNKIKFGIKSGVKSDVESGVKSGLTLF